MRPSRLFCARCPRRFIASVTAVQHFAHRIALLDRSATHRKQQLR
ncbi:hypothetical protein XCR_1440 [Xanthomonas campestris pv. raphani 756C]|nr:hypothetical protein XCR_1440 [Xanthomonas campestris pv. raphani 756C]